VLTIGNMLLLRRKELKLTQEELSKKTGISSISIGKYERGVCLPEISLLYRLTNALKINYNEAYKVLIEEKKAKKERDYGN